MRTFFLFTIVLIIGNIPTILGQTKKDSLFVFVGEKISVEKVNQKVDSNHILFDEKFIAKYKVLQNIFGHFTKDTIQFTVYDHYGVPAFSKYQNVLLYVVKNNGEIYHVKYLYSDVYKTTDNRWASSYKAEDYIQDENHKYNNPLTIQPEKIVFTTKVSYKIQKSVNVDKWFPSAYYKIEGDQAIAVYGNYVEDLFILKKNGILKAIGFFD